ncbi:MAG: hypothetical protein WCP55_01220, partial [Lentisphaerota bacterium]
MKKKKTKFDLSRLSEDTLKALNIFLKTNGQSALTEEQDKEICESLRRNPNSACGKMLSEDISTDEILTKEETKKRDNAFPIVKAKTLVTFAAIFKEGRGPQDPLRAVDLFLEEFESGTDDLELKDKLAFTSGLLVDCLKMGYMEDALKVAFWLGQEFMMGKLKEHVRKPTGANSEKNKPKYMKYGEMYHNRIIDNEKNGMGYRTSPDNPVTAKAEAFKYIITILKKNGAKECTAKNLDTWRDKYLDERKKQSV